MSADQGLAEIEETRARLKLAAREAVGVTGTGDTPRLRQAMRSAGVGWYPLIALGLLVVVDEFQSYALLVIGPEISRALGIEKEVLGGLQALKGVALALATLPMAAFVQKGRGRGVLSFLTGIVWGAMTVLTGFVANVWGLLTVMFVDGASTGSVRSIHPSLMSDSYPPEVRVRAYSFYSALNWTGLILAPLLVAGLTYAHLTWRGVFVVMGIVSLVAALFAIRLRDPGFGRFDTARVRAEVKRHEDAEETTSDEELRLGFFETIRRLFLIPTFRKVVVGAVGLGALLAPLYTYLFFFLDERWNLDASARGLFFAATGPGAIAAVLALARFGENLFRRDPAAVSRLVAALVTGCVVLLAAAGHARSFPLMFAFFAAGIALLLAINPPLLTVIVSTVHPQMRPHATAIVQISQFLAGGFAGLLLLGGIEDRFGASAAISSLMIPGFVAALIFLSAAKTVNQDIDRMLGEIIEEEELKLLSERGTEVPLLACRHIDFSYGRLQVLFDVSFSVEEGEMVALLGTNGAGKSTLLRVISGLGLPSTGSVRLDGTDITYIDAERRVRLGINQIASSDTVFAPLTVEENLKMYAYSRPGNGKLDECFEAFPRLAERGTQVASTLSGGEQQMLSLAKAFIDKPRLLLIDELSLGLAPKIVGELLDAVRRINAGGTAVVLVEQSVNVALALVSHAYFMEKGEIRFDGKARDLLKRPDLLRSVFLEGATKGRKR
ncbi:MAG: MFS transporter [Actinomycetota bacterium]